MTKFSPLLSPLAEVEQTLAALPVTRGTQVPETYIGGGQSRLRFLGLRVPQLHETMRRGFSFSARSQNEIAQIWNTIWFASDCYEVLALALAWFHAPERRQGLAEHWPLLRAWTPRLDNWAHSDALSALFARMHEDRPREVYRQFALWSESANPWERRQSIVSLFYYSAHRARHPTFAQVRRLLERQLDFDHYYVQKGVGWTLREAGNVYPAETFAFLEKRIGLISAHAFSAAVEKLSRERKDHLKRLRKNVRGRPSSD